MASQRTLNATNLEALGAAALAATEGADGAAREVRKRLAAIARATTVVDSRRRKALLTELEAQRRAISGPIAERDPALAFELLVRFVQLVDGVMARCSDSTGVVIGAFRRAAADLEPLARAAAIPPKALAGVLAELFEEHGLRSVRWVDRPPGAAAGGGGLAPARARPAGARRHRPPPTGADRPGPR
jgi:hypothetical protein